MQIMSKFGQELIKMTECKKSEKSAFWENSHCLLDTHMVIFHCEHTEVCYWGLMCA